VVVNQRSPAMSPKMQRIDCMIIELAVMSTIPADNVREMHKDSLRG